MKITVNKKDYFWSYFAYILKFGSNLIIFPLVLSLLNTEEYGLWITFSSLATLVSLFDFGFSSTILRSMTYVWCGASELKCEGVQIINENAMRDDRLTKLTFSSCKKIYIIIGLLAFIIALPLGTVYVYYITRNTFEIKNIIVWIIYCFYLCFSLYNSYWPLSIKAIGAIKQSQIISIVGYLSHLIISSIGLLLGGGIIALALSGCVGGLIILILSKIYYKKNSSLKHVLKDKKYSFSKEEYRDSFKKIWFNARKAGLSTIATSILTQSTTLFISAYLSLTVSGEYGVCFQLASTLIAISQVYYQASVPKLTQSRQQNDIKECQNIFSTSLFISWITCFIGFVFVVFVGQFALNLIKSQTNININLFIFVFAILFGELNYSMYASYISFENKLPFVKSILITSVVVLIASFIVIKIKCSIWSLLIVRLIIESAYIFWKWPVVGQKQLRMNTFSSLKQGFLNVVYLIKNIINIKKFKR